MIWVANLLLDFLVLAGIIRHIRDDRRRGIKIDWLRTFVICVYIAFFTAIAVGVLILCLELDQPLVGIILFVLIMTAGMVGLYIGANRIWPQTVAADAAPVEKNE